MLSLTRPFIKQKLKKVDEFHCYLKYDIVYIVNELLLAINL